MASDGLSGDLKKMCVQDQSFKEIPAFTLWGLSSWEYLKNQIHKK